MRTKVGIAHEPQRKMPWMVYWWTPPDEDGKQRKRSKAFRYRKDAMDYQTEKQTELNNGETPKSTPDVTLGYLLDQVTKKRLPPLSLPSRNGYRDVMSQLLDHFGADRRLREIDQCEAEGFMATRKRRNGSSKPLSAATRATKLQYCRSIFGAAIAWGWADRNPFVPTEGRGKTPLRVKPTSRPWHHLKPSEFQQLLDATYLVQRRAAYWLMYGCGLRPGEALNCRADQIDLQRRFVHVVNRESTEDVFGFKIKCDDRADESKERSVPIPEAAISDLTAAVKESFKTGGFVALTPKRFRNVIARWRSKPETWRATVILEGGVVNLARDLRRAGVELTGPFTQTAFRKSFAQNHANAGTHPKTLARLMGHSNPQMTMRYYNQVTDANVQAAAATQDALFCSELHQSSTGGSSGHGRSKAECA